LGIQEKEKAYKCFNPRLKKIMESINVMIDEIDVQKDKEGSKQLEERYDEKDLKAEEEEKLEAEQEEDEKQITSKKPSR
jgi:hypothetical protein